MKKLYINMLMITLSVMFQLSVVAQDWNIQTIDGGTDSQQLIRLDNNGIPHVLMDNYYYSWNGVAWEKIVLDCSYATSFCFDENGNPHIAGMNTRSSYPFTKYGFHVYFENGIQIVEDVYTGSSLNNIAIFFGPNSNPSKPDFLYYIHNTSPDTYTLRVTKYNSNTQVYVSTDLFTVSDYSGLRYPYADYCTDAIGHLYYVYTGSADEIIFNFYDGTIWSSFNITDGTNDCQHPRITLDQNDIPHVSYYDMVTKDLIHAKLPDQTMKMLKEGKLTSRVPSQMINK